MDNINKSYHDLLTEILKNGKWSDDPRRSDVKRLQIPDYEIKHNLTKSFPAITTKKLYWKGVVGELLWFLRGDTNIKYLIDNNINIWNKDAYNWYLMNSDPKSDGHNNSIKEYIDFIANNTKLYDEELSMSAKGDLGLVYGAQWRNFFGIDQIQNLIDGMKNMPMSTEHIVMAWNPAQKKDMALPPCHFGFIIEMEPLTPIQQANIGHKHNYKYGFTLKWFQRSVDTFLGLPFNIASYGLLAHILGKITNTVPLRLTGSLSNVHLYDNSIDAVKKQLTRDVNKYKSGRLEIDFDNYNEFEVFNYNEQTLDELFRSLKIDQFILPEYKSYHNIKVEMLERNE